MWKDYAVWQAAPWIAHRLGCANAYAVEYDNVSMGTPVALRRARATARRRAGAATTVLARRGLPRVVPPRLRERALALHVQLRRRRRRGAADRRRRAGTCCSARTRSRTGRFALQVKVPAGGSVEPPRSRRVGRRHYLDVADPAAMKDGLDEVSPRELRRGGARAVERSGARLADVTSSAAST